jgi:hypothetical protein
MRGSHLAAGRLRGVCSEAQREYRQIAPAAQENDDASFGLGQRLLRLVEREGVAAAGRVEEIEHRERFMHAHQRFLFRMNLALGQRQMDFVRGQVGIGVQGEFAVGD